MSESVTMGNVIPEAVRRQAERADALAREAAEAAKNPPPAPEEAPAAGEGEPRPITNPTPDAPPREAAREAPPPAPPAPPSDDWQQKYNTLKGKYDREVPSLQNALRVAEAQVQNLQGQVVQLNMARETARPAAPTAAASPEDVETYGAEFIQKAQEWAAARVNPELERLREQLAAVQNQTKATTAQQRQQIVESALSAQVPDWVEINNDPEFVAWLSQPDPFSGQKRHDMLTQAYTNGEAARTVAFFTAYRAEHTATGAAGAPAHTPTGAGTVPLENLAAPGRGRPTSPGAQPEKRMWTHSQIAAFYSDVQKGKYRNDEATKAKIEADIFAATTEGRIR